MTHDENKFLLVDKNQSVCWASRDSNIYKMEIKLFLKYRREELWPPSLAYEDFSDNKKLFPKLYFVENHSYM
jgi:hypothetical protein